MNKNNIFNKSVDIEEKYLYINGILCDNIIFGLKFLELFDINEYNLETGEINLYLNKSSNNLFEIIINTNNLEIKIIIFSFIIISIITSLAKIYHKNNKK